MIVSRLLSLVSMIFNFLDSIQVLMILCKLMSPWNLALLAMFRSECDGIAHLEWSFFGWKNHHRSSYIDRNVRFKRFLIYLRLSWTILEKVITVFRFFYNPKIASFCKNPNIRFSSSKKKSKKRNGDFSALCTSTLK